MANNLFINNFSETSSVINNFPAGFNFPTNFNIENLLPPENFPGLFIHDHQNSSLSHHQIEDDVGRKRKESSSSANGMARKNNAAPGRRGKRAKQTEKKPTEVVHVRAKRGQATDNHSLAERVRREKINEKLRYLQDIVPGCYKSMGMAVMLDEIINYVQSLQNQVEFLSMKLTSASTYHDFNSEAHTLETMQKARAFEAFKNLNGLNNIPLSFEHSPHFPQKN